MFGKVSVRRLSTASLFNLSAVAATMGLVAALQYGASARAAMQPSVCDIPIYSVAASPSPIGPHSNSQVTVTLNSAAPIGGCTIDLSYTNGSVLSVAPSSLTVSGGSTSGSTTVTSVTTVPSNTTVTITGSDDNNSQQGSLSVQTTQGGG